MSALVQFDVVKTVQFRIDLGDEGFDVRVEILRSRHRPYKYRAMLWRLEFYRIQSTFPQENNVPSDHASDELIWVDWSSILRKYDQPFAARSVSIAEKLTIQEIEAWLTHTGGKCSAKPHTWDHCKVPA